MKHVRVLTNRPAYAQEEGEDVTIPASLLVELVASLLYALKPMIQIKDGILPITGLGALPDITDV